jgi:hypothetical protein
MGVSYIPFERGRAERRDQGSFVAMELKLRSTENEARDDFAKLVRMHEVHGHPLTIFINIDSDNTHAAATSPSHCRTNRLLRCAS